MLAKEGGIPGYKTLAAKRFDGNAESAYTLDAGILRKWSEGFPSSERLIAGAEMGS
jgi:hypothetical protein